MHSKTTPRWQREGGHFALLRPELGFAAATFAGFAAWATSAATLHPDLVMPIVASTFFLFAGLFALAAWAQGSVDVSRVTYRDVAGVLTLIGICASATIDPEQMVQLVESGHTQRPR